MNATWKPLVAPIAAVAVVAAAVTPYVVHAVRAGAAPPAARDAAAASWRPIELTDLAAFAPPPPASPWSWRFHADLWATAQTRLRLTPERAAIVSKWTGRAIPLPWNELLRERLSFYRHKFYPPRNARAFALMNVAMYDALLAAHRGKVAHARPAPARVAPWLIGPLVADEGAASYPSEHAAASWAAARVIGLLMPEEAEAAAKRAEEASEARLWAGLNYPSDLEAGKAIGLAVADRLVAARQDDGANRYSDIPAVAAGQVPLPTDRHGGLWTHKVPSETGARTWRPWLLERPDAFRLPEPPRPGSQAFERELGEVLRFGKTATLAQRASADRFAQTAPSSDWSKLVIAAIERHGLSDATATRFMAYWATGQADAAIACWDSKFWWMQIRPQQEMLRKDPKSTWWPYLVTTPAHPAYPSGHCAFSGAAVEFLTTVFPQDEAIFKPFLDEMSNSRLWGGIHYRADLEGGKQLGRQVGAVHVKAYRAEL